MRSLWLSAAVAYQALLAPAAASVTASALSVDASAGLRAAQLSLTSALLEQPTLLEELCAIPLRGAEPLHHWEAAELHELQWPPLVAAPRGCPVVRAQGGAGLLKECFGTVSAVWGCVASVLDVW